ncbi:MAG: alpha/beta fold hydrolase [Planctomycetota bacterium]
MRLALALLLLALPASAQDRFDARDKDGDGKLSRAELPFPRYFDRADADKDGFVTREEAAAAAGNTRVDDSIRTDLDVVYAKREGVDPKRLSLDVYAPKSGEKHPVMVMIHGGAWRIGDKRGPGMTRDKVPHFVGAGYVYVSINYRLSNTPGVRHPAHVEDVAAALAWVHDHAKKYGGDPDRIFVMGHSAGAHLAALVATDHRRLAAAGKSLAILKGVICLDTAAYDVPRYVHELGAPPTMRSMYENAFGKTEALWRDASPRHHVAKDKGIPPMLFFHTGRRMAGEQLSRELVEALRAAGTPATAIHAADKDHAGINHCIGQAGDPYTAIVMRFLADPKRANDLAASGARQRHHTIEVDGRARNFIVQAPSGRTERLPVVFFFHGGGGRAENLTDSSFRPIVAKGKLIAVYPQGVGNRWNDGRVHRRAPDVDDVKFVRALFAELSKQYPVDRSRVFATGISNGAIFSHRLAAEASDLFAGIAPIVGGMAVDVAKDFAPKHPVSMLVIQGDEDRLVPIDGGGVAGNRGQIISTDAVLQTYARRNGITGAKTVRTLGDLDPDDGTTVEVHRYPDGKDGFRVAMYLVKGGGHTVPGGKPRPAMARLVGRTSTEFDAYAVIWSFFRACPPRS